MRSDDRAWEIFSLLALALSCLEGTLAAQPASVDSHAAPSAQLESMQLESIWYAPATIRNRDRWAPPETVKFDGRIQDFDAKRLSYIDAQGSPHELESNRVERVQMVWANDAARTAHQLFSEHKYRDAAAAIDRAIKSGIPRWQQRILLAELIEAADALGDSKRAGVFFVNLSVASPPAMLYAVIPLCWTTREPDEALKLAAAQWLEEPGELPGLLGASWMLLGKESDKAKRRLTQLQQSETLPISQLASAQLWRLTPPPETKSNLNNWFDFRDSLLLPLQIGPTEFLADRLSRLSLTDLAVGEWTRIATAHGERYYRATRALTAAQQRLQQENRTEEANRLSAWIDQLQQASPRP